MSGYDLEAALDYISPDDYGTWDSVGMALKHEGYDVSVWDAWSRGSAKYKPGECERKWRSFGNYAGAPVTGGTIVAMARDGGWTPVWSDEDGRPHRALGWDSVIGGKAAKARAAQAADGAADEQPVVYADSIGDDAEIVEPMFPEGHEAEELERYLDALFTPDEKIGYVTECEQDGERWKPKGWGVYSRTMGDVRDSVHRLGIEDGLSCSLNAEAGAYIRINPLDGEGVGNANITSFRHALLESDTMPTGKFAAIVKQLNLPVVALVDSGGKSLHAIVRVDAEDARQYRERVETLFKRCANNGIEVDGQNKNPSRLSRMPGVKRNGRRQFLAGLSQGASDWEEWDEWYQEATDELPDAVSLDKMLGDNLPPLKPELIEGVLRVGHKMLVSGPSKAGKSFALISLCIAFAEGGEWFGLRCRKSRVMYVNLELDGDSCFNRFSDMYAAMGKEPANAGCIDVWNLRGKSEPFGKLLPKLVRRCLKREVEVVVIDPIYKIQIGDENSAGDMAQFANMFDELCDKAGVSAIYCHHHSKGFQGDKRSIDRASGSGVFGRDPDAILDLVELDAAERTWGHVNVEVCKACARAVRDGLGPEAWAALPDTSRKIAANAQASAVALLPGALAAELNARCEAIKGGQSSLSAWKVEGTLREFPRLAPITAWFDWPLHVVDDSLADCSELGSDERPKGKGKDKGKAPKKGIHGNEPEEDSEKVYREINDAISAAVDACADDGVEPTRKNIHRRIREVQGKTPTYRQICRWTEQGKPWAEWVPGDVAEGSARGEKTIVRKAV